MFDKMVMLARISYQTVRIGTLTRRRRAAFSKISVCRTLGERRTPGKMEVFLKRIVVKRGRRQEGCLTDEGRTDSSHGGFLGASGASRLLSADRSGRVVPLPTAAFLGRVSPPSLSKAISRESAAGRRRDISDARLFSLLDDVVFTPL